MTQRDLTLDIAKGILILLVLIGHGIQFPFGPEYLESNAFFTNPIFQFIYSFHMPLFMLLSGYFFFESNKKNLRQVVISRLKSIAIPLFAFSFLCNLMGGVACIFRHGDLWQGMCRMLLGYNNLWFLAALLFCTFLTAALTRLFRSQALQYVAMALLVFALMFLPDGFIAAEYKFVLPFFFIGYICRNYQLIPPSKLLQSNGIIAIATITSALAIWWFDENTYIYISKYAWSRGEFLDQVFINSKRIIIAIVLSITVLLYIYRFTAYLNCSFLIKLGQASLFIYGVNTLIDVYYPSLLRFLNINLEFNYMISIAFVILNIVVCLLLYKICNASQLLRILFVGKK